MKYVGKSDATVAKGFRPPAGTAVYLAKESAGTVIYEAATGRYIYTANTPGMAKTMCKNNGWEIVAKP